MIADKSLDKDQAIKALNAIMEYKLAWAVRYTHYSLMVFGFNRIPLISWLKSNSTESLDHAYRAGELITLLSGHRSLKIDELLETAKHDISDILLESLIHESSTLQTYYDLFKIIDGKSVLLGEYACEMITNEEVLLDEVNKMLGQSGNLEVFK